LDENVKIQVWDSVSEIRYLVLPERPPDTEAMTYEELAAVVTRDRVAEVVLLSLE
jgi:nitrile hydratase subunit alpha